jgi:hypothetical protein
MGDINWSEAEREGSAFCLFDGYELPRVFEVKDGYGVRHILGNISGEGDIIDTLGNETGFEFDDVRRWSLFQPEVE